MFLITLLLISESHFAIVVDASVAGSSLMLVFRRVRRFPFQFTMFCSLQTHRALRTQLWSRFVCVCVCGCVWCVSFVVCVVCVCVVHHEIVQIFFGEDANFQQVCLGACVGVFVLLRSRSFP